MPKAKIYKSHTLYGYVWTVDVGKARTYWDDFDKAMSWLKRALTREVKEAGAYSMARSISSNLLSIDEANLVRKLCKSKCRGITPKQWGYIKGIHERQQREW
jgi:hypothetical protein